TLGGKLDQHATAVVRVPEPARVACTLDAVHCGGHGASCQAGQLTNLSHRNGLALCDDACAFEIGPIETERLAGRVIERIGRILIELGRFADGGDESVSLVA